LGLNADFMHRQGTRRVKRDERTQTILDEVAAEIKDAEGRTKRQRVCDLLPNTPVKDLDLVILRRYPRRLINTDAYTGMVAAACGRDETGLVGIVIWADDVDKVRSGDMIRIESGWCRMRDGELVVSTGRNGRLTIISR
jgi:ssDNA-binding replication factor A large subunit